MIGKKSVNRYVFAGLIAMILFAFACQRSRELKPPKRLANKLDTIAIYNEILSYPEFRHYLVQPEIDTVFLIRNGYLTSNYPLTLNGKVISFLKKPSGYPKGDEQFDYKKVAISFEDVNVEGDTATGYCFAKSMGLLGKFTLVKINARWQIVGYEKIMI